MKIISFVLLFTIIFSIHKLSAQTVLLKNTVPKNFKYLDDDKGPNRRHYSYSYFSIGGIISSDYYPNPTLQTLGKSYKISSGSTGKIQTNRYLGLLWDFEITYKSFALRTPDSNNTINYTPEISVARYNFIKLNNATGIQLNFKPNRGNQLGTYLSVMGYFDYAFYSRFVSKSKSTTDNFSKAEKNTFKKISYIRLFSYGLTVKFGKHMWDVFAKYRLSNIFKDEHIELPRLTVGIEFLMHQEDE